MRYYIIIIIMLFLWGCHSGDRQSHNVPSDSEISSNHNPALPCNIRDILPQVAALLSDYTFEIHYIIIREQLVLSIWVLVPELKPDAAEQDIAANSKLALLQGARICHNIVSAIPCVQELCDGINPMIVDKNYNCWYRDIIPVQVLTMTEDPSDDELLRVIMYSGIEQTYLRTLPPRPTRSGSEADLRAWPHVRDSIQEILCNTQERCNGAAYPLILNEYFILQVYWEALPENQRDDKAVYDRLAKLLEILSQTSIPVDRLEACITTADGRLLLFCKVNGYVIRNPDREKPLQEQIKLYHMD